MSCATASSVRNVSACTGNKTSSGNLFDWQTRNLSVNSFTRSLLTATNQWHLSSKAGSDKVHLLLHWCCHTVLLQNVWGVRVWIAISWCWRKAWMDPFAVVWCLTTSVNHHAFFLTNNFKMYLGLISGLVLKGNSIIYQWGTGHSRVAFVTQWLHCFKIMIINSLKLLNKIFNFLFCFVFYYLRIC